MVGVGDHPRVESCARHHREALTVHRAGVQTAPVAVQSELHRLGEIHFDKNDRASYERFVAADTAFHILLAEVSRNKLLLQAVRDVRCQMERIMYAAIDLHYYGELPTREHAGIVDALQRQDHDAARRLMQEHIFISKDKVLQLASNSRVL